MMTAERWYEYQESYAKYGIDMKPAKAKEERKTNVNTKSKSVITGRDKARLLLLTIVAGVLCIALIITTAYAAGVKYHINTAIKENSALRGEIENLNVKIKSASSISTVEERALNELGMVYPTADQYVYIGEETKPQGEMAMLIYEQAYN